MKREMNDHVDGITVDQFAATCSGTVDIDLPDARYMRYDDELVIVATVRVKTPRLKESKAGDITRVNVLGLKEVGIVRNEQLKTTLCEKLGLNLDGQMRFDDIDEPGNVVALEFDGSEADVPAEAVSSVSGEPEFDEGTPEEMAGSRAGHPSNGGVETVGVPGDRKDSVLAGFLYGDQ